MSIESIPESLAALCNWKRYPECKDPGVERIKESKY